MGGKRQATADPPWRLGPRTGMIGAVRAGLVGKSAVLASGTMSGGSAWHWLRARVDESVGMSMVRAVTGRRASATGEMGSDAGAPPTSPPAAELTPGVGTSFRAVPHAPRRIVISGEIAPPIPIGSGRRSGRLANHPPSSRDDARLRLWRDSALMLLGALLVALVGINLPTRAGRQGGVAGATGTPGLGAPLLVGSGSPSAASTGDQAFGQSPSPNGSRGPSPKPAGAPASSTIPGSLSAPSTYRPATPAPNPTPTNHATATPSPAIAPSVRPSPSSSPSPSPSPSAGISPSPSPGPSRTPKPSP